MNQTSTTIPGDAVRGVASGVFFMAFFGTLWAGVGIVGLQGWGWLWLSLVAVLIGIGLLSAGISLRRASQRLPKQVAEETALRWKGKRIWFRIIFATEGLSIWIVSGIFGAINRNDLIFPIMALIVGIHFFPLAALFQIKAYYLVGTLLCLLAIITLLVVPESVRLGDQQITFQSVVLGFGAALILWVVGLGLWLLGKRWLALSGRTPPPIGEILVV